jgi:hypothetical protein
VTRPPTPDRPFHPPPEIAMRLPTLLAAAALVLLAAGPAAAADAHGG